MILTCYYPKQVRPGRKSTVDYSCSVILTFDFIRTSDDSDSLNNPLIIFLCRIFTVDHNCSVILALDFIRTSVGSDLLLNPKQIRPGRKLTVV